MNRPNLLFVFSDQHRWCDLGCYGNREIDTPAFDAFSRESVRFTHCFSNSPLCVPARGSLLTGLFPLRHGAVTNDLPIRSDVESIGNVLNRSDYHTGYIGKWHLAGVPRPQIVPAGAKRLGFEEWKVNNCSHTYFETTYHDEQGRSHHVPGYEPAAQTDLAIDFMERNHRAPWSMVLSWGPPHEPYLDVPPEHLERYRERPLTCRANVSAPVLDKLDRRWDHEEMMTNLRGYYAHISALDEQFARLLETLERTGQRENTIVVYTSDHGDMLGSQGLTNKQLPYDEAIRVPLMVRWPERLRPGTRDALLGLVDVPVSLMGLMGLEFSAPTDGCDLQDLFRNNYAKGRDECYLFDYIPAHQASERGGESWRGLRTARHTLACHGDGSDWLLFDNIKDPCQQHNLVGDPALAAVQQALTTRLRRQIEAHDQLLPGDDFIRHFGLLETWNRSQKYFGLPILE